MYINHKIIFENNTDKKDKFFCDICNYPLITLDDFKSNSEYKCCHERFLTHAESRKKEWLAGWRPSKKEINRYIKLRKQINSKDI